MNQFHVTITYLTGKHFSFDTFLSQSENWKKTKKKNTINNAVNSFTYLEPQICQPFCTSQTSQGVLASLWSLWWSDRPETQLLPSRAGRWRSETLKTRSSGRLCWTALRGYCFQSHHPLLPMKSGEVIGIRNYSFSLHPCSSSFHETMTC